MALHLTPPPSPTLMLIGAGNGVPVWYSKRKPKGISACHITMHTVSKGIVYAKHRCVVTRGRCQMWTVRFRPISGSQILANANIHSSCLTAISDVRVFLR
ncbi:hypothetical protein COCC4DRAFT_193650 [Bipolaris maydis ATCC 48331]|uniref:Uncharacterized protein n=2 Tax=Cochliobolus heterostrophus TaxID=5016 RepID=M2TIP9_COCH5|nr:uncharacterized protein COCC4DRAFT_193650 [Bipolaris maydis ATCC 48331]EMD86369.1 hypothetical protein COCHEDRAFT_1198298 [Bipolaris maydis C5]ENI06319.1 hypothetical protein COCC4DRAFT_193650 [Bipolaris maydis ATCC 48331]